MTSKRRKFNKPKMPKVRHTWGINPVTRITPSKKHPHVDFDDLCPQCAGSGLAYYNSEEPIETDCPVCDGTGLS